MIRVTTAHLMLQLKKRWQLLSFFRVLLGSLALCFVAAALLSWFFPLDVWKFILLFISSFSCLACFHPFWKISLQDVTRFLDYKYPELEESASLFLKNPEHLTFLEKLQKERVAERIPSRPFRQQYRRSMIAASMFLLLSIGIFMLTFQWNEATTRMAAPFSAQGIDHGKATAALPSKVTALNLSIKAPAYTGLTKRIQKQFSIKAETGAEVTWRISTSGPVASLALKFNETETVHLSPVNKERTEWTYARTLSQPGFYLLLVEGKKSDLYPIEIIPDLPVSIKINRPEPRTVIDFGQPATVNLQLFLNDDYGIKDAFIAVTMASGKGEGVSFTEKKLLLNTRFNNQKQLSIRQNIDMKALNMKPGDEVYFYISAFDNRGQNSRSDVYFVNMVDTAQLMSMAGMDNGVNLVPEYFRSQRQIIIDTEKLLKEKDNITTEAFKNRANNLGLDQKLLRLRYGKFLGEESEGEIGGDDHDDDDGHEHDLEEQYAHNHDNAEDATYFEPELKAQLKAVLTEMWKAELQLRVFKPQPALPFEYKALRMLKDLQQSSRAYVAKTTVKTSQLNEEKRLTGELDKIFPPVQHQVLAFKNEKELVFKKAQALLEQGKAGHHLAAADLQLLHVIEMEMIKSAADYPAIFLPALRVMRMMYTTKTFRHRDIELLQAAIQKMMEKEHIMPNKTSSAPASNLYQAYFNQLKLTNP